MSCFIDGHENNNDNLGFEQCVGLIYLKSVDKGMVSFLCVLLLFRASHLLYFVDSPQLFLVCWKGQGDSMLLSFDVINRT